MNLRREPLMTLAKALVSNPAPVAICIFIEDDHLHIQHVESGDPSEFQNKIYRLLDVTRTPGAYPNDDGFHALLQSYHRTEDTRLPTGQVTKRGL